jgi:copper resistance protein B
MLRYCACLFASLATPAAAQVSLPIAVELDLLEMHFGQGDDHFVFDGAVTAGLAGSSVQVRFAGGSDIGPRVDEVEVQGLYGQDLVGFATLLAGVRHDFRDGADLSHATVGIEGGLTPWADAESFLFLSQKGNLTGSAEVVGNWELPGSLTLEPRVAVGWSAQDIAAEDTAKGLTELELTARLRRQVLPGVDLYLGATQERLLGGTRDIAVAAGDRGRVTLLVVGGGISF